MSLEPELPCCLPMPSTDLPDLPSRNLRQSKTNPNEPALAVNTEWFWDVGTPLYVRFLNQDTCHEKLVKVAAQTWERYANIHFIFDDSPTAQIRIKFDENFQGGKSLVGKCESEKRSLDEPTMVLGSQMGEKHFRRTALHELGHALGCVHEHASPVANIEWNEKAVIGWYDKKGYSEDWVRANVFLHYESSDSFQTTLFDENSIMIYPIFPGWAANIKHID